MPDQVVQLPSEADNTGKLLDHSELGVAGRTVLRQRLALADDGTANALARVLSGTPAAGDFGLLVRALLFGRQSDGTQTQLLVDSTGRFRIAGADDAGAAASGRPVVVGISDVGGLVRAQRGDTAGNHFVRPPGYTWTVPVRTGQVAASTVLLAANAARKRLVVTNAATALLYVRLDGAAPILTAGTEVYHYSLQPGATLELADGEAGTAAVYGVWAAAGGGYAMSGEAA